ncbi:MAG: hypothetical protein LUI39_02705 [Lachnospiraceae bacterium]|nr:hypothetical protein [Lachnospiraceae bacterium]
MKRYVFVLLLLNIAAAFALPCVASAEQETFFSLDGQEYSFAPVLGDFLENGWEKGSVLETFGYSWSKGPYEREEAEEGEWVTYMDTQADNNMVSFDSGYELTNDADAVGAYLDQSAVEYGQEPAECPLEHLGVPAGYVDSLVVNGAELANADYTDMVDAFGEPETMEDTGAGVIFSYSLPELSALISFVYEGASGDEESLTELKNSEALADEICLYFALPTIGDVSFSLNGQDYLIYPVMGDFLENGWELGERVEQMGDWSEEEGPYNVVTSGYYLTSRNNQVAVYLDDEQIRAGEASESCFLRSLNLYGDAVESLQINGHEIAGVTREQLVEILGEPRRLLEETYGTTYYYSLLECGITMMTVNYSDTGDAQAQISISF